MWRINFSHRIGSSSSLLAVCGAMLLSATVAEAQMLVNIVEPALNATASGSLQVRASVSSVIEVSTVTAEVEGQQVTLKYSQPLNAWTNSVPLAGIAFGSHTLVVNARDPFGGTSQAMGTFIVDNPPTLAVRELFCRAVTAPTPRAKPWLRRKSLPITGLTAFRQRHIPSDVG